MIVAVHEGLSKGQSGSMAFAPFRSAKMVQNRMALTEPTQMEWPRLYWLSHKCIQFLQQCPVVLDP